MSRPPSPTNTEWQTFQVMANPNFVNIRAPKPTFRESPKEELRELAERQSLAPSPPSSPIDENHESISVVAERQAKEHSFKPILETHPEVDEEKEDDFHVEIPESYRHEKAPEQEAEEEVIEEHSTPANPSLRVPESKDKNESRYADPEVPKISPEMREKARRMNEHDILLEKEGLLSELEMMQQQGIIKLYRELSIRDSLEDIQFQQDRAMANQNAIQTVEMAKTSIKAVSMLLQMAFAKMGLKLLDGFSDHMCKDMNRFNRPLTRMYRKQWRGTTLSAETELAMIVFGSVLVTIMHNKGLGMFVNMMPNMMGGPGEKASEKPPMARPMPPAPTPPTWNSAPSQSAQEKPSIPVMRRPQASSAPSVTSTETKEPTPTKTIHLPVHGKAARKRNDDPVINL